MIPQHVLDALVGRIVEAVHPTRVILFGSAARNEMGPNSDLDVLVVMPDGVHRRDTSTLVYRSLHRFGHAIDIVVATEGDLVEHSDNPGLVFRQALLDGKELYRAA